MDSETDRRTEAERRGAPTGFRWITEDRREAELDRRQREREWERALGEGRN